MAFFIAAVQAVVVAVTLPRGSYAATVMALKLVVFTALRLQTGAGGFCGRTAARNQQETAYEGRTTGKLLS